MSVNGVAITVPMELQLHGNATNTGFTRVLYPVGVRLPIRGHQDSVKGGG